MKTMKANSEFHIKDLGEQVEMTTVLFTGLIEGIRHLERDGYEILTDSCIIRGSMYIVPAMKPAYQSGIIEMCNDMTESISELPVQERNFDDLTKKDELLEYASDMEYKIPGDLKLPSQIKKYIKELEEVKEHYEE